MKNVYNFEEYLNENEQPLFEDYQEQAARNQANMQSVVDRMQATKEKSAQLDKISQGYKEKASKTEDDIAKAVYAAKISTNAAKKNSYQAFMTYLQAQQSFFQAKAKEIEARMKAGAKRKV